MLRYAVLFFIVVSSAAAQDRKPSSSPFQQNLLKLSELFGALHHIRSLCEPNEATVWRDSMRELIRIEDPSRDQRRRMTEKFNDGYHAARREAKIKARDGSTLAARLDRLLR